MVAAFEIGVNIYDAIKRHQVARCLVTASVVRGRRAGYASAGGFASYWHGLIHQPGRRFGELRSHWTADFPAYALSLGVIAPLAPLSAEWMADRKRSLGFLAIPCICSMPPPNLRSATETSCNQCVKARCVRPPRPRAA
jgi:hypothetical protein